MENEILNAEKAESDRRTGRNNGYGLMRERDRGWARLSNGALIQWHTPRPKITSELPDYYVFPPSIPPTMVAIDGKLYDTEDLRKWLRWA
jgi:hypothetical protein